MLTQITEGVWTHTSSFLQSNAVVVQGKEGVLLIDPGITSDEMAALAHDLQDLGQPVVAGYSTHPHWDHLLWHASFGDAPRYGTQRNEAEINAFLSNEDWKTHIAPMLPPELAEQIPTDDLFGRITGLDQETRYIPWNGPRVRIIEHDGHAAGSAALLIEENGILIAGDMLSDILIPFLELDAADPVGEYLAALDMFKGVSAEVSQFIPGHGSSGDVAEMRARIEADKVYVTALHDGDEPHDPRLTTSPNDDVHQWQAAQVTKKYA